jgi:hypothetical protein
MGIHAFAYRFRGATGATALGKLAPLLPAAGGDGQVSASACGEPELHAALSAVNAAGSERSKL